MFFLPVSLVSVGMYGHLIPLFPLLPSFISHQQLYPGFISLRMKLTKRVCARCVYVCGVLCSHTKHTKGDGGGGCNYEGVQLQILRLDLLPRTREVRDRRQLE